MPIWRLKNEVPNYIDTQLCICFIIINLSLTAFCIPSDIFRTLFLWLCLFSNQVTYFPLQTTNLMLHGTKGQSGSRGKRRWDDQPCWSPEYPLYPCVKSFNSMGVGGRSSCRLDSFLTNDYYSLLPYLHNLLFLLRTKEPILYVQINPPFGTSIQPTSQPIIYLLTTPDDDDDFLEQYSKSFPKLHSPSFCCIGGKDSPKR